MFLTQKISSKGWSLPADRHDRPAASGSAASVGERQAAGIRTVMITGDFANTARAIAESIGLLRPGHQVLTGPELE